MPPERIVCIHLDPVGGLAGDMFAACLLDAFPELAAPLAEALGGAGLPPGVGLRQVPHRDHALTGSRVVVDVPTQVSPSGHYGAIAARLRGAPLAEGARRRALAIYELLAQAEAKVHGVPVEEVHFHELADWDSYADIVAAAWLIERLDPERWSVGPLPLGSGRVRGQHGVMPVPAPATATLLEGMAVIDDGVAGERVTPTGAAILRHLSPQQARGSGRVAGTGHGFGTRVLDGIPNVLRALILQPTTATSGDRVGVIRFEIDDQTAEDLAIGLDRVRRLSGVRDVCQWPALGKKGRMMAAVQVLCDAEALDAVANGCLAETSTIGLRCRTEERRLLERDVVESGGQRVKRVQRPGGEICLKAEADDLDGSYAFRQEQRMRAERR